MVVFGDDGWYCGTMAPFGMSGGYDGNLTTNVANRGLDKLVLYACSSAEKARLEILRESIVVVVVGCPPG